VKWKLKLVLLVMEFAKVDAVFKLGFQAGWSKLGRSTRGAQVGVL
jgi:hypothetical protein